jgi:hypothetical protein
MRAQRATLGSRPMLLRLRRVLRRRPILPAALSDKVQQRPQSAKTIQNEMWGIMWYETTSVKVISIKSAS